MEALPCCLLLPAFSLTQDWYIRLAQSQCWTRSDSALLEGAELLSQVPPDDLSAFMMNSVWWGQRDAGVSLLTMVPLTFLL